MSKEPKVKKAIKNKHGIPTMKEMLDIEFNVPDFSISNFDTGEQYHKWLEKLSERFEKLYMKQQENFAKDNGIIEMMLIFLDKYPELFAENYAHEVSRDMMKFYIHSHMDKCQKLIDRIEQIEKDLDLPIH